ncbi:MAG TPA: Crp/Fnr family transcriptional regulator [Candidatus Fournierella merdigallinarum]|nr:Crp/Fnr family transcriptional regulator [Candidatus Fournierella merdigallinarum]
MFEYSDHENSPWITMDLEGWAPLTEKRPTMQCRKKSILFHQDDEADAVFIVKSGRLRITSYQEDGAEKQLYIAETGSMVGESSCLNDTRHQFSAVAIVDSVLWRVPVGELLACMQRDWQLNRRVISLLCRKKDVFFRQILDLSFKQATHRIASQLLNLCHQYGKEHEKGVCISIHFTQQDIAGIVNASRVTVGNVFNMFMDQGLLVREGKYFIVTDLDGMEQFCKG